MAETVAIHALARPSSICAVCVRDESKALGTAGLAVLGQEDTSDTAVALEDLAEVVFFGEFGDLGGGLLVSVFPVAISQDRHTFVTRRVARSSRSNLPPILSPVVPAAPFRKCGGT